MKKQPFSESFQTTQNMVVAAKSEQRVFYGTVPLGFVGFLGVLASNDYDGVIWSWYIDDECVESNILHALGDMNKPEMLKPPYVVKKNIEVKAKNLLDFDVMLMVYCDGIFYEDIKPPSQFIPFDNPTMILKEIKAEMMSKNPVGEVTDELINVTDVVRDVYDEAMHGLQWTICDVVNRGPNNVYIAVNEWKQPVAPLAPGEAQNIDLGKRGSIKKIYLKCDAGETAQVRFHVLK